MISKKQWKNACNEFWRFALTLCKTYDDYSRLESIRYKYFGGK